MRKPDLGDPPGTQRDAEGRPQAPWTCAHEDHGGSTRTCGTCTPQGHGLARHPAAPTGYLDRPGAAGAEAPEEESGGPRPAKAQALLRVRAAVPWIQEGVAIKLHLLLGPSPASTAPGACTEHQKFGCQPRQATQAPSMPKQAKEQHFAATAVARRQHEAAGTLHGHRPHAPPT